MKYFAVACVLIALPLFADDREQPRLKEKPAWEWTIDERLAKRFDVELAARRAAKAGTSDRLTVSSAGKLFDAVDGTATPELFMPNELFSSLLGGLDGGADFRQTSRAILLDGIRAFGWDEAVFWRELENAASSYLSLSRERVAMLERANAVNAGDHLRREIDRLGPQVCGARADALAVARSHFGKETFDRFLYTVVAPTLRIGFDTATEASPSHLLFLERGCK